jgi:hypothetical protein
MNSTTCRETPGKLDDLGGIAHFTALGWCAGRRPRSSPDPFAGEKTEGRDSWRGIVSTPCARARLRLCGEGRRRVAWHFHA